MNTVPYFTAHGVDDSNLPADVQRKTPQCWRSAQSTRETHRVHSTALYSWSTHESHLLCLPCISYPPDIASNNSNII